ncbi:MAG: pyruvate dehydrogenase complex dihydrolipoamide acetyltransferase [Proteobacteria bacterium]|jgi:pyruvate dehydrogenase E2 component (dihydrolipoamide acetyltransferase)|nr:pyruvate dehydrogenase complex dihydrolipoamide acetyltransferase [Pseudomonadota bacterium]
MAIEILMPALSPTMEEGNLAKWLKKEGDAISSGDVIAEIETDKATMEVEATDAGTLGKIIIPEGTNGVKVNALIAILLEKGEDVSALEGFTSSASKKEKPAIEPAKQVETEKKAETKTQSKSGERVFASPLAKRIAEQENIDITAIEGSGPNGRVVKKDLAGVQSTEKKSSQVFGRNSQESYTVPHSNMRKVIAKRLLESKQTVPHFYVSVDASVKNLNKARKEINNYLEQFQEKVSVNDIIVKCCANALRVHPNVNASWGENGMTIYNNVDVSIAVGIDGGLITPIVKNADIKSLRTIANETKDLIKRAKSNKLSLEEFQGGGFSVSNLGMYNVSHFNAIINPPQSAIIAIGGVKSVPKLCKKTNTLCEDEVMTLTLSCDHRVIDGVLAAEFLNSVKSFIENPNLLSL